MSKSIVIAVDGFSSTGKSTLAKQLAKALEYTYVDSGAMYRAVTFFALENNLIADSKVDEASLIQRLDHVSLSFDHDENGQRMILNGTDIEDEIRGMRVSSMVSEIATISAVRQMLVKQQQEMAKEGGLVMDGRDIGTVVFPNADLKIFVTASPATRAQRRCDELAAKGEEVNIAEVQANLEKRDKIDSTREDSPLRQADDARVLDNTFLSMDDQLAVAYTWAQDLLK